jgi:hypothetical protein
VDTTEPADDLEGDLGTVTDEEWRTAHEAVTRDVLEGPPSEYTSGRAAQFAYDWSPGEVTPGGE